MCGHGASVPVCRGHPRTGQLGRGSKPSRVPASAAQAESEAGLLLRCGGRGWLGLTLAPRAKRPTRGRRCMQVALMASCVPDGSMDSRYWTNRPPRRWWLTGLTHPMQAIASPWWTFREASRACLADQRARSSGKTRRRQRPDGESVMGNGMDARSRALHLHHRPYRRTAPPASSFSVPSTTTRQLQLQLRLLHLRLHPLKTTSRRSLHEKG